MSDWISFIHKKVHLCVYVLFFTLFFHTHSYIGHHWLGRAGPADGPDGGFRSRQDHPDGLCGRTQDGGCENVWWGGELKNQNKCPHLIYLFIPVHTFSYLQVGKITGDITVNGHPKDQATWSRVMGYVEQMDIHTPAQV